MPLSEHVYCVVVTFKMTEQIEQQICVKFCINPEHSSAETNQVIQKVTAISNWWLVVSLRQHTHSYIMSHAEFFSKTSNYPGDSAPLQPRFGALWLLAFPKTKITFEREEISDRSLMRFSKTRHGSWWQLGELCEVSRWLLWKGLKCHCPMYEVSCIFFNKCLYFSYYMAGYFQDSTI